MVKTHTSREFYPWYILYLPVYVQYLFYALISRDFAYMYDTNPSMPPQGGIMKFSKWQILHYLDESYRPKTVVYTKNQQVPLESIEHLGYPLICKPDGEERGTGVTMIADRSQLFDHFATISAGTTVLCQEYIDYPIELGIFRYRYPDEKEGKIAGITTKQFTIIIGDGIHTIAALVEQHPRAKFYKELFAKQHAAVRNHILLKGEKKQLNHIGNHCKGTLFLDGGHLISEEITTTINRIMQAVPGFYYGRIDLRTKSIEDISTGKYIKIMEINGIQSESTEMYDPAHSLRDWYSTLIRNWHRMFLIARQNRKKNNRLHIPFLAHMKKSYISTSPLKTERKFSNHKN